MVTALGRSRWSPWLLHSEPHSASRSPCCHNPPGSSGWRYRYQLALSFDYSIDMVTALGRSRWSPWLLHSEPHSASRSPCCHNPPGSSGWRYRYQLALSFDYSIDMVTALGRSRWSPWLLHSEPHSASRSPCCHNPPGSSGWRYRYQLALSFDYSIDMVTALGRSRWSPWLLHSEPHSASRSPCCHNPPGSSGWRYRYQLALSFDYSIDMVTALGRSRWSPWLLHSEPHSASRSPCCHNPPGSSGWRYRYQLALSFDYSIDMVTALGRSRWSPWLLHSEPHSASMPTCCSSAPGSSGWRYRYQLALSFDYSIDMVTALGRSRWSPWLLHSEPHSASRSPCCHNPPGSSGWRYRYQLALSFDYSIDMVTALGRSRWSPWLLHSEPHSASRSPCCHNPPGSSGWRYRYQLALSFDYSIDMVTALGRSRWSPWLLHSEPHSASMPTCCSSAPGSSGWRYRYQLALSFDYSIDMVTALGRSRWSPWLLHSEPHSASRSPCCHNPPGSSGWRYRYQLALSFDYSIDMVTALGRSRWSPWLLHSEPHSASRSPCCHNPPGSSGWRYRYQLALSFDYSIDMVTALGRSRWSPWLLHSEPHSASRSPCCHNPPGSSGWRYRYQLALSFDYSIDMVTALGRSRWSPWLLHSEPHSASMPTCCSSAPGSSGWRYRYQLALSFDYSIDMVTALGRSRWSPWLLHSEPHSASRSPCCHNPPGSSGWRYRYQLALSFDYSIDMVTALGRSRWSPWLLHSEPHSASRSPCCHNPPGSSGWRYRYQLALSFDYSIDMVTALGRSRWSPWLLHSEPHSASRSPCCHNPPGSSGWRYRYQLALSFDYSIDMVTALGRSRWSPWLLHSEPHSASMPTCCSSAPGSSGWRYRYQLALSFDYSIDMVTALGRSRWSPWLLHSEPHSASRSPCCHNPPGSSGWRYRYQLALSFDYSIDMVTALGRSRWSPWLLHSEPHSASRSPCCHNPPGSSGWRYRYQLALSFDYSIDMVTALGRSRWSPWLLHSEPHSASMPTCCSSAPGSSGWRYRYQLALSFDYSIDMVTALGRSRWSPWLLHSEPHSASRSPCCHNPPGSSGWRYRYQLALSFDYSIDMVTALGRSRWSPWLLHSEPHSASRSPCCHNPPGSSGWRYRYQLALSFDYSIDMVTALGRSRWSPWLLHSEPHSASMPTCCSSAPGSSGWRYRYQLALSFDYSIDMVTALGRSRWSPWLLHSEPHSASRSPCCHNPPGSSGWRYRYQLALSFDYSIDMVTALGRSRWSPWLLHSEPHSASRSPCCHNPPGSSGWRYRYQLALSFDYSIDMVTALGRSRWSPWLLHSEPHSASRPSCYLNPPGSSGWRYRYQLALSFDYSIDMVTALGRSRWSPWLLHSEPHSASRSPCCHNPPGSSGWRYRYQLALSFDYSIDMVTALGRSRWSPWLLHSEPHSASRSPCCHNPPGSSGWRYRYQLALSFD